MSDELKIQTEQDELCKQIADLNQKITDALNEFNLSYAAWLLKEKERLEKNLTGGKQRQ